MTTVRYEYIEGNLNEAVVEHGVTTCRVEWVDDCHVLIKCLCDGNQEVTVFLESSAKIVGRLDFDT